MELRDLLVTPVLLVVLYAAAYIIRPYVTDSITKRYFIPALTVRIIGAVSVGLIYQFYYSGGDTYNYHTHGSRYLWEAFRESPETGLKLLFADGVNQEGVYKYSSKIYFFTDFSSYNIIRIAGIIDLFTFSTYSATAIVFAVFSFGGIWMLFLVFYRQYPDAHRRLALAVFFIPSVFFWGSGLLKDTVTLTCLAMATYGTYSIFLEKKYNPVFFLILAVGLYGLYAIKIYILLNFLPSAIVWVLFANLKSVRSPVVRYALFPMTVGLAVVLGYWSINKASEDNPKYSLNMIAKTSQITAYDIRYWTGRKAGSGYTLGDLDGSLTAMVRLAPQAINVTLFRPYLWEANNVLMLLSAIESLIFLTLTIYAVIKAKFFPVHAVRDPNILFCLIFSLTFAFAVGASTYNFGTLTRYKIPMMPFYGVALVLLLNHSNKDKKVDSLEAVE